MSADYGMEPNAEMRQMAKTCWQMYQALTQQGFTDVQAMQLLGETIRAQIERGSGE